MKFTIRILQGIVVLLLVWLPALQTAAAQSEGPAKVKELVYHVNAFQGAGWTGVLYPQSEKTIYLLSGQVNTIAPRQTLVYYWSITQRYLPDWNSLDESITARLEIRKAGQLLSVQKMDDYLLQDDSGNPMPDILQLFTGEEARKRRKAYQEAFDAFWNARWEYYMNRESESGLPELKEPEPPKVYITALMRGFILNLEPGMYTIQLIDDLQQVIPGSQKDVLVFAPRRLGVGYSVIPEQKWTVRDFSATPEEVIYIREKIRLFLKPQQEGEFVAYYYQKLLDPQVPLGNENSWRWFPFSDLKDFTLHILQDSIETQVPNQDYVVEQTVGNALGYSILPFKSGGAYSIPAFSGHEINLSLSPGQAAVIWLTDSSGRVVEGSQRSIRGVREPFGSELLLMLLIPMGVVVSLAARSHRLKKQSRKSTHPIGQGVNPP